MNKISNILLLLIVTSLSFVPASPAQNMADGLQCPPGWQRTKSVAYTSLIKQCIAKTNDGLIELYASRSMSNSLERELDGWTSKLRREGKPYQRLVDEGAGHVSGYPALVRTFYGYDKHGRWYDSHLAISKYNGIYYTFIGYTMKGHDRVRIQLRHAMNDWHYPGVSGPPSGIHSNSGNPSVPHNNQNTYQPNDVSISQNTNLGGDVNVNPTININKAGCTRHSNQNISPTDINNNSGNTYTNTQNANPTNNNSGNTYPSTQNSNPPDSINDNSGNTNSNSNDQNTNKPSNNGKLDYLLN